MRKSLAILSPLVFTLHSLARVTLLTTWCNAHRRAGNETRRTRMRAAPSGGISHPVWMRWRMEAALEVDGLGGWKRVRGGGMTKASLRNAASARRPRSPLLSLRRVPWSWASSRFEYIRNRLTGEFIRTSMISVRLTLLANLPKAFKFLYHHHHHWHL